MANKKNTPTSKKTRVTRNQFVKRSMGLFAVLAIGFQVMFNIYLWNAVESQETFRTATLVTEALEGVDELKTALGQDNKLEEMNLVFPDQTDDVEAVKYIYTPEDTNSDYPTPAQAQVTTRLLNSSVSKLLSSQNIDDLFNTIPSVQACSRGFTLQFTEQPNEDTDSPLELSGTKKLNDSRTLYVYKEANCNLSYGLDELEQYLLSAESY